MKMYINGEWVDRAETMPVFNPFDQSVIDTVPRATAADVELAITSAARAAKIMAKMPAHERYQILNRAAQLMAERLEDLGRTITLEEEAVLATSSSNGGDSGGIQYLPPMQIRRITIQNRPGLGCECAVVEPELVVGLITVVPVAHQPAGGVDVLWLHPA